MALTRWRVRMEIEPGRRQILSVVASISLAGVLCLVALMWSACSPAGQLDQSNIIADKDSNTIVLENYDLQPVQLTNVKRERASQ